MLEGDKPQEIVLYFPSEENVSITSVQCSNRLTWTQKSQGGRVELVFAVNKSDKASGEAKGDVVISTSSRRRPTFSVPFLILEKLKI